MSPPSERSLKYDCGPWRGEMPCLQGLGDGILEPSRVGILEKWWYHVVSYHRNQRLQDLSGTLHPRLGSWLVVVEWLEGSRYPNKKVNQWWCYGETIRDHGLNIPKAKDVWSFKDIIHPCHFSPVPTESRNVQPNQPVIPFPPNRRNCETAAFTSAAVQVQPHIPRIRWGSSRNPWWWFHPFLLLGIHRFRNTTNLTYQKRLNEHL